MYKAQIKLRVRYAETDQMGFVYYGQYASYFEVARVESLRTLGISYREMEERGILLPVYEYGVKFLKPAGYDQELTVTSRILELPAVRLVMDYETRDESGVLLNTAKTTLVFLDKARQKPTKAPEDLLKVLKPHFT